MREEMVESARVSVEVLENRTLLSANMVLLWNQHAMEAIRADRTHGGPTRTYPRTPGTARTRADAEPGRDEHG